MNGEIMQKEKTVRKLPFIITAIVNVILLCAVFFLMRQVRLLLDSDVKINLTEIVTQNKDLITSKLALEMNNLSLVSKQLSDQYKEKGNGSADVLKDVFLSYADKAEETEIFIADESGTAIFSDEQKIDISGRNYFRLGMQGINNISERTISRRDGEDIFVICIPITCDGQIIGTVQKQYTPQQIYNLCSVSLFSEKGNMKIINSQGYILIDSSQEDYPKESDNYYRQLYLEDPTASKKLEQDIKNNCSGFMENSTGGAKFFTAYTPIDQVYDWYLLTSVATNAVSPNSNIVVSLFYYILLVMVLVFGISLFYILTSKARHDAKIRKVAFVDTVTGGNTFAKLQYESEGFFRSNQGEHPALMAFDIDNFKYINNFYGFDTGDLILKQIYQEYEASLGPREMIARVYGDHFVILLEDGSPERLEQLFRPEIRYGDIIIYCSAGLYFIPDSGESINLMIDKANTAKRQVKEIRYKTIRVYTEEMNQEMVRDEQMKRFVEQAIVDDEIIPYFQPKVDINTGKLAGAEALARWQTKDGKLIPPGTFIPVCEKTGLIVKIDFIIFEKTLQFLRKNLEQGIACVPVSVNFSRVHFLNDQFLPALIKMLEKYEIPSDMIEIEITETAIFDNYELMGNFIKNLHANGLRISMDDFGSGYSSLHMLKDIPIDVLKIDQGFLVETANSAKQKIILAAITQMAAGLDIKIVVEGVETFENVELMRELNCFIAQGYYFARPMPQSDFEAINKEGHI